MLKNNNTSLNHMAAQQKLTFKVLQDITYWKKRKNTDFHETFNIPLHNTLEMTSLKPFHSF